MGALNLQSHGNPSLAHAFELRSSRSRTTFVGTPEILSVDIGHMRKCLAFPTTFLQGYIEPSVNYSTFLLEFELEIKSVATTIVDKMANKLVVEKNRRHNVKTLSRT